MLGKQKYFVYFLQDPEVPNLGYIGYTDNLKRRFSEHCSKHRLLKRKTPHNLWLHNLRCRGLKPVIRSLGRFWSESAAMKNEIKTIARYRKNGFMLLNSTKGGEKGGRRGNGNRTKKYLEKIIIREYLNGKGSGELSKIFSVGTSTVLRILRRHKIQRRSLILAKGGLIPRAEQKVCSLYTAGMPAPRIAEKLNCTLAIVYNVLRRRGIKRRTYQIAGGGLDNFEETSLCVAYINGLGTWTLGQRYKIDPTTAHRILKRHNIHIRTSTEANKLSAKKSST